MEDSSNSNIENNYNSSKSSSSSSEDSSKRTISYEAPSHSFSNKDCTISEGNKTAKEISGNIIKIEELKILDSAVKSVKQEESILFTSESETVRMFSSDPQNECKSGVNSKISLSSETQKSKGRSKFSSQRVYLPCSSYINIEENIRSKRLIKNIEDKVTHSDEGVKSRVQKSEKQVKIASINKILDKALYKLECFVHNYSRYEYGTRVSENIYGSLKKKISSEVLEFIQIGVLVCLSSHCRKNVRLFERFILSILMKIMFETYWIFFKLLIIFIFTISWNWIRLTLMVFGLI